MCVETSRGLFFPFAVDRRAQRRECQLRGGFQIAIPLVLLFPLESDRFDLGEHPSRSESHGQERGGKLKTKLNETSPSRPPVSSARGARAAPVKVDRLTREDRIERLRRTRSSGAGGSERGEGAREKFVQLFFESTSNFRSATTRVQPHSPIPRSSSPILASTADTRPLSSPSASSSSSRSRRLNLIHRSTKLPFVFCCC